MKNAQTSAWRQKAKAVIAEVLASHCVLIPSSLPIETQKELLGYIRDAYPFGQKCHWPYTVWRQEVRKTFGLSPGYQRRRKQQVKYYSADTMLPSMIEWARERGLIP